MCACQHGSHDISNGFFSLIRRSHELLGRSWLLHEELWKGWLVWGVRGRLLRVLSLDAMCDSAELLQTHAAVRLPVCR